MSTVNIHEAKARLSHLLQLVEAGEEVVIARRNVPVARLVPIRSAPPRRELGGARGLIEMAPDFDAPIDDFASYMEEG